MGAAAPGRATIADVGDRFAGDQLGDDPLAAFERAHAAALTAVDEAPDRDVHLSFGDTPRAEYTLQLAADHLVHAWDLARAVGEDDTLDAGAVEAVREWFGSMEDAYRGAGVIGTGCRSTRVPTRRPRCWRCSGGRGAATRSRPSSGSTGRSGPGTSTR